MKTMMRVFAYLIPAFALAAFASDLIVTEQNASTFYREFTRLTKRPHRVAPLTATLCKTPDKATLEREQKATGPHYHANVHLYANAAAMPAITNRMTAFPVGSVIVKEKLSGDQKVLGVGGMIKRATGYDASNETGSISTTIIRASFHPVA